ncbi:MAG TPA: RNA polymerase sigma factor [Gemmatimonadaceae bacterium]|nr:RNA polymerase sigma factor [Gemmatimonadaceae bacterium]
MAPPTLAMRPDPESAVAPPDVAPWELVARAAAGDTPAFTALVAALHPTVHRWALVFAADPDEADDIVQDAFVQMYRHLARYQRGAPLEAWLYRIVRRAAGQRRRATHRRRRLAASARARPERDVYVTDPGARVDRQWVSARIRAFFGDLPARQREIFDLVDLQGFEPSEVARMIGMNAATVRTNLFKARAAVRAHLIARHPGAAELTR